MKQLKFIALFFAIIMTAALIFACTGKEANKPLPNGGESENGESDSSTSQKVFDPIIVGDQTFTLPHVPQDIPIATTTTTRRHPSNPGTPNTPSNPSTPEDPDLPSMPNRTEDPEAPTETPVKGSDFDKWFNSMTAAQVLDASSAGIKFYNDTTESLPSLYDGLDGCTTEDWSKMGGGASRGSYVVLEVEEGTSVKAYALITANDSETYERTPGSWRVLATNENPESATDSDWTEIDYVYDGATENKNFAPFGYTIDSEKVGAYRYYKFVFLYGIGDNLNSIQLAELWLLK